MGGYHVPSLGAQLSFVAPDLGLTARLEALVMQACNLKLHLGDLQKGWRKEEGNIRRSVLGLRLMDIAETSAYNLIGLFQLHFCPPQARLPALNGCSVAARIVGCAFVAGLGDLVADGADHLLQIPLVAFKQLKSRRSVHLENGFLYLWRRRRSHSDFDSHGLDSKSCRPN